MIKDYWSVLVLRMLPKLSIVNILMNSTYYIVRFLVLLVSFAPLHLMIYELNNVTHSKIRKINPTAMRFF